MRFNSYLSGFRAAIQPSRLLPRQRRLHLGCPAARLSSGARLARQEHPQPSPAEEARTVRRPAGQRVGPATRRRAGPVQANLRY